MKNYHERLIHRLSPALLQLLRWRYPVLGLWLVYWAGRKLGQGADWPWFVLGTNLLFRGHTPEADGPGGLHTFATLPELHMGPLSLVVAAVFRALYPSAGKVGAAVFMCALGPLVVLIAERAAVRARGLRNALDEPQLALVTLVSGAAFLYSWTDVTWSFGRLDEFMVICAAAAAFWFVVNGNPLLAGATVGLAIGTKSWAVFLLPLLAALPLRNALRAGAVALAVATTVWLPFVIADSGTIESARAIVRVHPASGAHVLGIGLGVHPDWLRPLQATVALGLAAIAVARGRWAAALLLAVGARLALDPAPISYYAAALVFAALIWDLFGSRRPLPIWSVAAVFVFHTVPELINEPQAQGMAKIAFAIAAILTVLGAPTSWLRQPPPIAVDRASVS